MTEGNIMRNQPIPPHLHPIPATLGEDDLMFMATSEELAAIAAAIAELQIAFAVTRLIHRDGSPWIEIDAIETDRVARAWTDQIAAEPRRTVRLALWRYTLAVYRVGADSAVEDEPIWTP
jgi:hypothetical protein